MTVATRPPNKPLKQSAAPGRNLQRPPPPETSVFLMRPLPNGGTFGRLEARHDRANYGQG